MRKRRIVERFVFAAMGMLLALVAMPGAIGLSAQETEPITFPITPDAALCTVEPRDIAELEALFTNATPSAEPASVDTVEIPVGTDVDDATRHSVIATLVEAEACINAGDFPRFFAFLSDAVILESFSWVSDMMVDGHLPAEFTTPQPPDAEGAETILAVADVTRLSDGTVGALLVTRAGSDESNAGDAVHLVLALQGEHWTVVDAVEFDV